MPRLSPMVRSALFVRDLDRAVRFYRDVLGLAETWFEGDLSDGNAHELLGRPPGTTTRAAILKAEGPAYGMVGLFQVDHPAPPAVERDPGTINAGETCLVFYCDDLDPVTARLGEAGATVLCAPVPLRIGDKVKQREMCFRDPDGILVNLIEWDPADPRRPETEA